MEPFLTPETSLNLETLRFLIVDRNRHMRLLVKSILHSFGVRLVEEAGDGSDGLAEMKRQTIDFVITGLKMDPLDGLDFTRIVRTSSDSASPYVPIIMLTGRTEFKTVTMARDAGVNELLAKPVSVYSLYKRIAALVLTPCKFIRTPTFFGPDRRRAERNYNCADRRSLASEALAAADHFNRDLRLSVVS